MSMNGVWVRIGQADLEALLANKEGELITIRNFLKEQKGQPAYLDLLKDWGGLHFLLNVGDAAIRSAAAGAVECGAVIGGEEDEGFGYGPIRYFTPKQVCEISDDLQSLTDESLALRYDATAMNSTGVYPGGWEFSDNQRSLLQSCAELRYFFREAAEAGDGILLFLR